VQATYINSVYTSQFLTRLTRRAIGTDTAVRHGRKSLSSAFINFAGCNGFLLLVKEISGLLHEQEEPF
jgi:hypothetical protein